MFRCRLALRQKKVPASLTWWHFSEVQKFFSLWFSADSGMQKINCDKFDQWRIRRRMWRNMYQYRRSFSHKRLRREDFARSVLPWRRAPDQRQRSAGRYLYIYLNNLHIDPHSKPNRSSMVFIRHKDCLKESLLKNNDCLRSLYWKIMTA